MIELPPVTFSVVLTMPAMLMGSLMEQCLAEDTNIPDLIVECLLRDIKVSPFEISAASPPPLTGNIAGPLTIPPLTAGHDADA